jgi:hypothetical protein
MSSPSFPTSNSTSICVYICFLPSFPFFQRTSSLLL